MIDIIVSHYATPKTTSRLQPLLDEAWGTLALYATQVQKKNILYTLFSGGKDSMVTTHIASQFPGFHGLGHVRTHTGPASEQHSDRVVQTAEQYGWPIIQKSPSIQFPAWVIQYGFPGPAAHTWMYIKLKERAIRMISREVKKPKSRLLYITGIRAAESAKRAKVGTEVNRISDNEWWVNPILNWSDEDVFEYVNYHGLHVSHMGHSLDCFCGAYAHPDEREMLQIEHPDQYEYILLLEDIAKAGRQIQMMEMQSGHRKEAFPEAFCQWGHGMNMQDVRANCQVKASLCSTCDGRMYAVDHDAR